MRVSRRRGWCRVGVGRGSGLGPVGARGLWRLPLIKLVSSGQGRVVLSCKLLVDGVLTTEPAQRLLLG